jgi:hypothetical protein
MYGRTSQMDQGSRAIAVVFVVVVVVVVVVVAAARGCRQMHCGSTQP